MSAETGEAVKAVEEVVRGPPAPAREPLFEIVVTVKPSGASGMTFAEIEHFLDTLRKGGFGTELKAESKGAGQ